jgi:hypothetical protein
MMNNPKMFNLEKYTAQFILILTKAKQKYKLPKSVKIKTKFQIQAKTMI